jgi:hypothetical protein
LRGVAFAGDCALPVWPARLWGNGTQDDRPAAAMDMIVRLLVMVLVALVGLVLVTSW